jgi:FKBP-type peptidyl-prolyl cis-trans isomerase SlpA
VVRSIEGDLVVVDFNHPLAGKNLIFDVSILKVEPIAR